jgi:hypothetical protein
MFVFKNDLNNLMNAIYRKVLNQHGSQYSAKDNSGTQQLRELVRGARI